MIKNKLLIFVVIVFACAACGTKKSPTLALNLEKGKVYQQIIQSEAEITQKLGGQDIKSTVGIAGTMSYLVKDVNEKFYTLEARYTRLSMEMKMLMNSMKFDSEAPKEKDIFSKILAAMKDKPFRVEMFKNGKIKQVKNLNILFDGIFDEFPEISKQQKAQIKQQLEKSYGKEAIKGNIEMVTAIFPDKEVKNGEKWNIKTRLESGMSGDMETEFELKETTDTYYNITGKSTIKTDEKADYVNNGGMFMKLNLKGTMTSDIKVDKQSGWIIEAKLYQEMKGNSDAKGTSEGAESMKIPMVMKNNMTISNK